MNDCGMYILAGSILLSMSDTGPGRCMCPLGYNLPPPLMMSLVHLQVQKNKKLFQLTRSPDPITVVFN